MYDAAALATLTVDQISALSRDEKLIAWQEVAGRLAAATIREKALRMMAVEAAFPGAKEGTQSIELGNQWIAKATIKMNYTVANTEEMKAAVTSAVSPETAARLVKYKPELSISEWRNLTNEQRFALGPHVTIKPGMPTLEILAPGAEGNKR